MEDTESNEYFGNSKEQHEERQRHRHLSMPSTDSPTVSSYIDCDVDTL